MARISLMMEAMAIWFFTGRADAGHPDILVVQVVFDGLLGVGGLHAPEALGTSEFDIAVIDVDIDRFFSLAFDDHDVVAGEFQPPPGNSRRSRPCPPRPSTGDLATTAMRLAPGHIGPGQRTGSKNQLVGRAEGIGFARHFVV